MTTGTGPDMPLLGATAVTTGPNGAGQVPNDPPHDPTPQNGAHGPDDNPPPVVLAGQLDLFGDAS